MKKLIITSLITGLCTVTYAADKKTKADAPVSTIASATQEMPKVLQFMQNAGFKFEKSFPAIGGITGYVVSSAKSSEQTLIFLNPDKKSLFVGALIDETGQNLTQVYASKYFTKPEYNAIYNEVEKSAAYLVTGEKKNPKMIMYAFMDPNCIFCHLAYKALLPYTQKGLQVRWIPVAFLKQDSGAKAAALLASKDADKSMADLNAQFSSGNFGQGTAVDAKTQLFLTQNRSFMDKIGSQGTPLFIYKDSTGKANVRSGMITLNEIPTITGIPFIPNDDPELKRFQ